MKNLILILCISLSKICVSQVDPLPFPINGKWIFMLGGMGYTSDPIVRMVVDTVDIGEHSYWNLGSVEACPYQDDFEFALIRTENNRWYTYFNDGNNSGERLHCDFNLNLGDSTKLCTINFINYQEDSIDYLVTGIDQIIFTDNVPRRKWTLHPQNLPAEEIGWNVTWIEGIGSLTYFGFVDPPGWFDLGYTNLMCFGDDPENVFSLYPNGTCCWIGSTEDFEPSFSIFPNPASDKIFISFENISSLKNYNWTIKNLTGQTIPVDQPVATSNQLEFNVKSLPNGIYFMIAELENRRVISTRIVVNRDSK